MHGHLNVKFVSIRTLCGGERSTSRSGHLTPAPQTVLKKRNSKISPHNLPRRHRQGVDLQFYSFLNLGARCGWVDVTPRPLYLWERSGTHCIGGRVGPRAGLDGCGNYRLPPRIQFSHRLYANSHIIVVETSIQ